MKINEIIIVGGGQSISQDTSKPLLDAHLSNRCVILTNYAYRYFKGTFLAFIDRDFYKTRDINEHPDIYEELSNLPMIVGVNTNGIEEFKHKNTILLDKKKIFTGSPGELTGIFALSLALKIINRPGCIFLLGYDWTRRNRAKLDEKPYTGYTDNSIHFYNKEIKHSGIGRVGYYENHNPDKCFDIFQKERDVDIYNVSLESNINCFEKISYEQMYLQLNKNSYFNQNELQNHIKSLLSIL